MTIALAATNINKTYQNGTQALCNVSLQVNAGEFFALLGPNGAGKTTLIGIISSLVNKTSGTLTIFGHNIDKDSEAAKRCIGIVPQEFNFDTFEKVENIVIIQAGYYGLPYKLARERAEYYLRRLGLWGKRKQQARMLSGGMKRRLMIARALVHEPKLLILDEPTAGVDLQIRLSMWAYLQELNTNGTTIILTTHYLEEAEALCKHIAIIDHGKIITQSTMDELLAQSAKESYILYTENPLNEPPNIKNTLIFLSAPNTLEVDLKPEQLITSLCAELQQQGILIKRIKNKTNRLERLFVELTGDSSDV